jgi:hypothetical protein
VVAFTPEQAESLLGRIVAGFNAGVRSGDFAALIALFTDDGVLDLQGIPGDPFAGREEIVAHFRDDPPDDEISVRRWKVRGETVVAEFYWHDISEAPGGCFTVEPRGDRVARLTVALGGPERCWR